MNRRQFLQQSLGAAAGVAALGLSSCLSRGERPNILMVVTDDQSYPHAGAYGSAMVSTPAFDRVAREGVLFRNAFVSAPSCCPARGSILSGQQFYRLREAAMNHTVWPTQEIPLYTDMLAQTGYKVGYTGKGWGPGNWEVSGRTVSPAGQAHNERTLSPPGSEVSDIDYAANFEAFLDANTDDSPFCFWAGVIEPHRAFNPGIGVKNGKKLADMVVPAFLPDTPETRGDLADYAFEIEWFDQQLGRMLAALEERRLLNDTVIFVTSDNGMAFPRAKGNLYDYGTRIPLAVRWGRRTTGGRTVDDLVGHCDLAPTILEATGLRVPGEMTGTSLMYHLDTRASGQVDPLRDAVVFGIERHLPGSRPEGAGYPSRAIRTAEYLYIRNFTPDRNPVGDHPGISWPDDDPVKGYGDTDGGRSKSAIFEGREQDPMRFEAAFGKRPAEELYKISDDPFQMKNLASDVAYDSTRQTLSQRLMTYLRDTRDPRVLDGDDAFAEITRRFPVLGSNTKPVGGAQ
ncbi:MAG: sulfatase [Bryobacterales bacterium]|nr:sulfatase [Bryobacterales bacterium]